MNKKWVLTKKYQMVLFSIFVVKNNDECLQLQFISSIYNKHPDCKTNIAKVVLWCII